MEEKKPPKVFVSYSHDSSDHKRWVADLATSLRKDGIDIIFDQWDLSLGDDITRFMEEGVVSSDRVLLICTENYVQKADAGIGGVAYERMIVTAELVNNLGTPKFIPVVRQNGEKPILPKFMGARFFVNLSAQERHKEQYENLLRELHKEPAIKKPPIGKNPFSAQHIAVAPSANLPTFMPLNQSLVANKNVTELYDTALEIARQGDLIAWRRMIKEIKLTTPFSLQDWRKKRNLDEARAKNEAPSILNEAVELYAPLFAVALAGIQSGQEKFRDQRSLMDELLNPSGWQKNGCTSVVEIPRGLIFVYQALCGATFLDTDQLSLVIQLAQTRVSNWYGQPILPLIESPELVGWPASLEDSCLMAWNFLVSLTEKQPWLSHIFGSDEDYRIALSSYYMALHIHELACRISKGKGKVDLSNRISSLLVPVSFLNHSNELIAQKAYRLLRRSGPQILWESQGVPIEEMRKHWPDWMKITGAWLYSVHQSWLLSTLAHEKFFEEYDNV